MFESKNRTLPVILIFGPVLTAVSGVSTHVRLLQKSALSKSYTFVHFIIGSEGKNESKIASLLRFISSPLILAFHTIQLWPEIVHINTSFNPKSVWRDFVYLLIVKMLGRKVVYQIHGGYLPEDFCGKSKFIHSIIRKMLSIPEVVVLLCDAERQSYLDFSPIQKLEIIPNAIDLGEYDSFSSRDYNSTKLNLGYIGRLVEVKGIQHTIKALSILQEKYHYSDFHFQIAGSGPYEDELKKLVQVLNLSEFVSFLGPVFGDNKTKFWKTADLFVFPTYHQEGLPYTILESMAAATPMVLTRMGAMDEVVENHKQGVFIEPEKPEELAKTLFDLLNDRNKLRDMSSAALKRVQEAYGIQQLSSNFQQVYRALVNEHD